MSKAQRGWRLNSRGYATHPRAKHIIVSRHSGLCLVKTLSATDSALLTKTNQKICSFDHSSFYFCSHLQICFSDLLQSLIHGACSKNSGLLTLNFLGLSLSPLIPPSFSASLPISVAVISVSLPPSGPVLFPFLWCDLLPPCLVLFATHPFYSPPLPRLGIEIKLSGRERNRLWLSCWVLQSKQP